MFFVFLTLAPLLFSSQIVLTEVHEHGAGHVASSGRLVEVTVVVVGGVVFSFRFFFPERGRNGEKREKRGELLSLSLSFGVKETQRIKILSKNSPPPPQQARLVLEGHHFRSGDRGARVEREDVFYRRGGLALDL